RHAPMATASSLPTDAATSQPTPSRCRNGGPAGRPLGSPRATDSIARWPHDSPAASPVWPPVARGRFSGMVQKRPFSGNTRGSRSPVLCILDQGYSIARHETQGTEVLPELSALAGEVGRPRGAFEGARGH